MDFLIHVFMHSLVESWMCPDRGSTCILSLSERASNQVSTWPGWRAYFFNLLIPRKDLLFGSRVKD